MSAPSAVASSNSADGSGTGPPSTSAIVRVTLAGKMPKWLSKVPIAANGCMSVVNAVIPEGDQAIPRHGPTWKPPAELQSFPATGPSVTAVTDWPVVVVAMRKLVTVVD